jgi:two-component system chemotaxis response regulator CheB
VLFQSMAEQLGKRALGMILTGMGKDGAQGLLAMRQAGAWNIGQDQASCVVYGMPREAANVGALDAVAPLAQIPRELLARLKELDSY